MGVSWGLRRGLGGLYGRPGGTLRYQVKSTYLGTKSYDPTANCQHSLFCTHEVRTDLLLASVMRCRWRS